MSEAGNVPSVQRWPTVPEPTTDPNSLYNSLQRIKETVELLTGQRGTLDPTYSVDTVRTILTKTVNDMSATVSNQISVIVSDNAALAEQVNLIEAEVVAARDGEASLNARIVEVDQASVTRDTALAVSIDSVSARVDDVSAGGFFKTTAAVTGGTTLASMEAQVYTTTAHTGTLTAGWRVQISGGVSYFDMYTGNWRLIDTSGVPKAVMTYGGGYFQFTGDVLINGNLLITGTVNTYAVADVAIQYPKIYPNAVSSPGAAEVSSGIVTVTMNCRAGAIMLIVAGFGGFVNSGAPGLTSALLRWYINGGAWRTLSIPAVGTVTGVDGSGDPVYSIPYAPATYAYVYIATYTGSHTFQFDAAGAADGAYKNLTVLELAR